MRALTEHAALIARGGEVLTATARQAEALKRALGLERAGAGEAVWATPRVRPLAAWLERAFASLEERPVLLSAEAATRLWQRIVDDSPAGQGLVNSRAAAAEAERAWRLLAEWRLDPSTLERTTPEQAAFRDWARAFATGCRERGVIDRASLGSLVAPRLGEVFASARRAPVAIGFHGFASRTPLRAALGSALEAAGVEVLELTLAAGPAVVRRLEAATPATELEAVAAWLRERLDAEPGARLGVIVPDLAQSEGSLRRLLDDRLAPVLKAPGAPDARPYRLGTGRRLADFAVVDAALGLLALGAERLDVLAFGRLLRSPYLKPPEDGLDAPARAAAGARLDAALRRLGTREVPATELLKRMREHGAGGTALARSLEKLRGELKSRRATAMQWAESWPKALRAVGWPLGRTLGAAEYAAAHEFYEVLARFAGLGRVLGSLDRAEAHGELAQLIAATPFEPDVGAAPVLVLDALEDPGVPFDGLWVAGLTADRFPGASAPNPFLSPALQRSLGMPAASAEAVLAEARVTLEAWQRATPELVLSSARHEGDTSLLRSGLLPAAAEPIELKGVAGRAQEIHAARALEDAPDPALPPLAAGLPFTGGVRGLERQSSCPFLAAAELRLHAQALESPGAGLPRRVRGELMHDALARFWRGVRTHAALVSLGAGGRADAARRAVDAAFHGYHRGYLPAGRLRELEARWLTRALAALADVELTRVPFAVEEIEQQREITLAGRTLRTRLDRLDRLEDGATVLIDYKTGRSKPRRWVGPRPDSLQLAVYAAHRDEPPDAVAIARLPLNVPAHKKFAGLAARSGLLPHLGGLEKSRSPALKGRTWGDLLDEWRRVSAALAADFAAGVATVDPEVGACDYCALAALCRIDERALSPPEGEETESDPDAGATALEERE